MMNYNLHKFIKLLISFLISRKYKTLFLRQISDQLRIEKISWIKKGTNSKCKKATQSYVDAQWIMKTRIISVIPISTSAYPYLLTHFNVSEKGCHLILFIHIKCTCKW